MVRFHLRQRLYTTVRLLSCNEPFDTVGAGIGGCITPLLRVSACVIVMLLTSMARRRWRISQNQNLPE